MYDVSKSSSFANIERWMQELRDHADPNIVIILVGNKCDLKHLRAVRFEEGKSLADKYCKNCYLFDMLL